MIYVLFGENDFLINEKLKEIKGKLDPVLLAANFTHLDGRELVPSKLSEVINTVPFLAPHRISVVDNLLERFEVGESFEPWLGVIKGKPDSSWLVLVSRKLSRQNPALNSLRPIAQIKEFPLLRGGQLETWVGQRLTQVGGKITPGALRLLIRMVGEDQWRLSTEIEKLSLYAKDRVIQEKDIFDLVTPAPQMSIFRLIDAWIEGKGQPDELYRLLKEGEKPSHILTLLSRQLGLIARAKEMLSLGLNRKQIQEKLGLSDYPLEKTLRQCHKLSISGLREMCFIFLETDLAIKTGRCDPEIALDILQARLLTPSPSGDLF